MKLCVHCLHFIKGIGDPYSDGVYQESIPQCSMSKPASLFTEWGTKEPVFGRPNHLSCLETRTYDNLCGPSGKWWEKKK